MARQQDKSVILYDGVSAPTLKYQQAQNQTTANTDYEGGDLVQLDSSTGYLKIADAGHILGIACSGNTITGASVYTDLDVELINGHSLYTIASDTVTARAEIGDAYEITYDVGGHMVNVGTAGAAEVTIYGIYLGNDDTTSGGRLIVRFNMWSLVLIS